MSEYRLDINGTIGLSDYTNIHDYMGVLGEEDKLVVALEPNSNDHNADIISTMLQKNNFVVSSKGGHDDGKFYITAYRKK